MKICAGVRMGSRPGKPQCDDRLLIGDKILSDGFYELETEEKNILLAVADGVGGCQAGWKAAEVTLEEIRALSPMAWETPEGVAVSSMIAQLQAANNKLLFLAGTHGEFEGMASTVSMACVTEDEVKIFHLGDTRVYQLRNLQGHQVMRQLTEDHNLLRSWKAMPQYASLLDEELKQDDRWSHITSYMGMNSEELEAEVQVVENISRTGTFLLTSDGVHDYVEKSQLTEVLDRDVPLREKIELMMNMARENGSMDDQAVIIAAV